MNEFLEVLKTAGSVAIYCLIVVVAIDKLKLELTNKITELELRLQKVEILLNKRRFLGRKRKNDKQ